MDPLAECSTYGERMCQVCLQAGSRGICQFGRLAWAPLVIFIARDLNLSTLEQGKLLSAFPLGYLLTQIAGGMAADRFGGKPVQMMTLMVFAGGMLLGPTVAAWSGVRGLYWIYFFIGFFTGPQHPANMAMAAAWIPRDELGLHGSISDMVNICGELLATVFAPVLASMIGWRSAFVCIGLAVGLFCVVWLLFAKSRPPLMAAETSSATGSAKLAAVKEEAPATPPLKALLYPQVWAPILQHMCFNGAKYFFTAWIATYYDKVLGLGPAKSAGFLSAEKLAGLGAPMFWRMLEKFLRQDGNGKAELQLLRSRKIFAALGFGISCVSAVCLLKLHASAGQNSLAPLLVAVILCINSVGMAAHGFSYRPNYLDLTKRYSGAFVGFGNMFATLMTYVVPLGAAYLMEANGGDWSQLFIGLALLNVVGAVIGVRLTSVTRLDDEFEELAKKQMNGVAHHKSD